MENESMTLPMSMLKKYAKQMFIETGTYDGRTVKMALDAGFEHVISIETDEHLFKVAMNRFNGDDRVSLILGDSVQNLTSISGWLMYPALFWLDAHVQESYTWGSKMVPLLDELDVLIASDNKHMHNATIMIDDMRCIGVATGWENITRDMITERIFKINKDYTIVYEDSKVAPADIMVAFIDESLLEDTDNG